MSKKNLAVIIFVWSMLCWPVAAKAATLLEANWAVGSVCSTTNIKSGVWTQTEGVDDCSYFGIGTSGVNGANYLRLVLPASDVSNWMTHNPSLGSPATMYVRYWFRFNYNAGAMHPFEFCTTAPFTDCIYPLRAWDNSFSIIPNAGGGPIFYYSGGITHGTWYRVELKFSGVGTSLGSCEVRLNGVDITSSMVSDSDATLLTTANGSLEIPDLNYVSFSVYYGQGEAGNWLDMSGLKITDGPDWIGGLETATTATMSGITAVGVSIQ